MCSSAWVQFPGSAQASDVRPYRFQGHILVRERHRFQGMNSCCGITASSSSNTRSTCSTTTHPNAVVAPIHHPKPTILVPDAYDLWLDPEVRDELALAHWLSPYPAEEMAVRPASRPVNGPKHDSQEFLA
jgi:putative SOS response-associated peptidase YedK